MSDKFPSVKCNECGWIHFAIPLSEVQRQVKSFNDYYNTLTKKEQKDYYGGTGLTIKSFTNCFRCGNIYTDFKKPTEKDLDAIFGSTVQPILDSSYVIESGAV